MNDSELCSLRRASRDSESAVRHRFVLSFSSVRGLKPPILLAANPCSAQKGALRRRVTGTSIAFLRSSPTRWSVTIEAARLCPPCVRVDQAAAQRGRNDHRRGHLGGTKRAHLTKSNWHRDPTGIETRIVSELVIEPVEVTPHGCESCTDKTRLESGTDRPALVFLREL